MAVSFDGLGTSGRYAIDPNQVRVVPGSWVVVESGRGRRLGRVTTTPHEATSGGRIRRVVRVARDSELERQQSLAAREPDAFRLALTVIRDRRLPLKLVRVMLDAMGQRATVCVAAPDKIDLSDLGRELQETLQLHVTFRQLGLRDVAKVLGGVGRCGRELCCSTHLTEYPRTSIRMAKDQGLSLNEDRVEGVCGRTLCCLAYEQEFYKERRGFLPKLGKTARTTDGTLEGKCIGADVMAMTFVLLDKDRARHRLPATAWDRNSGRDVPTHVTDTSDIDGPAPGSVEGPPPPKEASSSPRPDGLPEHAISADEPARPSGKSTTSASGRDEARRGGKNPRRRRRRPTRKPDS